MDENKITVLAIAFIAMAVIALIEAYIVRDYKFKFLDMSYQIRLLERELKNYRNPDAIRKEMEEIEKMIIDSLREVYGNGDDDG